MVQKSSSLFSASHRVDICGTENGIEFSGQSDSYLAFLKF
jgi:hypothetical protein